MPAEASVRLTSAARLGSIGTTSQPDSDAGPAGRPSSEPSTRAATPSGARAATALATSSAATRTRTRPSPLSRVSIGPSRTSLPGGDDPDHVGQLADLAEEVARDEHRLAGRGEVAEGVAHGHDPGRVEPVGRLVEEEQPGVIEQRSGDPQSLFHPERVVRHLVAAALPQPNQLEDFLDPVLWRGRAARGQGAQIGSPRQVRVEGG